MAKSRQSNRKKRVQQQSKQLIYIAMSLILVSVFSMFSWGFMGIFLSNSTRFFVGEMYRVCNSIVIIYAIYALLKKTWILPFTAKQWGGIILLILSILTFFSLSFPSKSDILGQTMTQVMGDLLSNNSLRHTGGGVIGALLATGLLFLFGEIGTILLLIIGIVVSVFLISDKVLLRVEGIIQHFKNRPKRPQMPKEERRFKTTLSRLLADEDDESKELEDSEHSLVEAREEKKNLHLEENNVINEQQESQFVIHAFKPDHATKEESHDDNEQREVTFSQAGENENYVLPPLSLLNQHESVDQSNEYELIKRNSQILENTFKSFGVNARVISANLGPSVTKFEIQPAVGVKVSKIVNLSDDIALALAAKDIRIEAPIPGKSYIGIEVPNQQISTVSFREIIEHNIDSKSKLEVPLGRDVSGNIQNADLSKMPHLLVAGATGSGKSVAINGMITSILMKAKPNEVKLMMIDPKKVELNVYNGIPHLLTPVVTNPRRAAQALQKVVVEMERRYELFAQTGMRNITGYNEQVADWNSTNNQETPMQPMPYIVVIVDELADLMMVASNEVESAIIRLAQMARAAGIHMVLATQRPSVDVITGLIKANVPSRMAFAVSSSIDSRTIIDGNGAEKLLGKGDMLFMPMGENKPLRVQGAFLSDQEVEKIVEFVKTQQEANYVEDMMPTDEASPSQVDNPDDELIHEVIEFLKTQEYISVSMLQRRFRVGFNRAARLMESLEAKGYVGEAEGTKPRRVLPFE